MRQDAKPAEGPRKGYIIRLFGVVLIFLGVMDSMLSWRGGFTVSPFYLLLIGGGILLYAIGAIRRGAQVSQQQISQGEPR